MKKHDCKLCGANSWNNKRIYMRKNINNNSGFVGVGWLCLKCGNLDVDEIDMKKLSVLR